MAGGMGGGQANISREEIMRMDGDDDAFATAKAGQLGPPSSCGGWVRRLLGGRRQAVGPSSGGPSSGG